MMPGRGPAYIPAQLRFAYELSAADTARLFQLAESVTDPSMAIALREPIESRPTQQSADARKSSLPSKPTAD